MKFKKILSGFLACATFFGTVPYLNYAVSDDYSITATANGGVYGNINYWIFEDHIEIQGSNKSITSAEIPSEIDGLPVTCISNFSLCPITEIIIPDSVTDIKYMTFYGCTDLKKVKISDSITKIKDSVFLIVQA